MISFEEDIHTLWNMVPYAQILCKTIYIYIVCFEDAGREGRDKEWKKSASENRLLEF